jgi:hypothetical protein
VSEQFLDRANVVTVFEEMRREGVPEGVTRGSLGRSSHEKGSAALETHADAWLGGSVMYGVGVTRWPGISAKRKRCAIAARIRVTSIVANVLPMHWPP